MSRSFDDEVSYYSISAYMNTRTLVTYCITFIFCVHFIEYKEQDENLVIHNMGV